MMVLLRRSWVQLTADRRKLAALCVMLGLGLLLWARLIVMSNMPRTAVADPSTHASVSVAPVLSDKPRQVIRIALDERPERDPFVVSDAHFPKSNEPGDLPGEAGKSLAQQTEDPERAEARLRAQLRALIDRMTLDAAMHGAGLAIINGRTYRTGDRVSAADEELRVVFTLVQVQSRSVVLQYEERRFELKMTTPGG